MTCTPKLKNGEVYSFQKVDCSNLLFNITAMMLMMVNKPYASTMKFGEEDGKTILEYSESLSSSKLYKVSNSTDIAGGNNTALIIIIVVVVVVIIILIIVLILVLASKKKQKTKKLPTKTVSDKPAPDVPVQVTIAK